LKYIILFEDNPNIDKDIRRKHMPQHLQFLQDNKQWIHAAGPLQDSDNHPAGGLWIVDADDEASVDQLIKNRPALVNGFTEIL